MTSNALRRAFNFPDAGFNVDLCAGSYAPPARTAYRLRLATWILRFLAGAGGMPPYCEPGHPRMNAVAELIEVPELADPVFNGREVQKAIAEVLLRNATLASEEFPIPPPATCSMRSTIEWLGQSAGLNVVEQDVYELAIALRVFGPLRIAVKHWGDVSEIELVHGLSGVINRSMEDVMQACDADSALFTSGLVCNYHHGEDGLEQLLSVSRSMAQLHQVLEAANDADFGNQDAKAV